MTTADAIQTEKLSLKAWSDNLNTNKTIATYSISADRQFADIVPSPEMDHYFKILGLPKKASGYELDLVSSPIPMIAKSLGFHYDDPAIRHSINAKTGGMLTSENLISLALEGDSQLGTLESHSFKRSAVKKIDLSAVVDADKKNIPEKLFTTSTNVEKSIKKTGVLIKAGNHTLRHGYFITCENDDENQFDRLALYAAGVKNMATINNLNADAMIGFKMTQDGKPALLCIDTSRPEIKTEKIIRGKNESGAALIAEVARENLEARTSQEPAGPHLRKSKNLLPGFIATRQIKSLLQNVPGFQFNSPTVEEGKLSQGALVIPRQMSLKTFLATAKEDLKQLDTYIKRHASLYHHELTDDEVIDLKRNIQARMVSTLEDAKGFKQELSTMVKMHAQQKIERVEKPRAVREYSIEDLEM